MSAISEDAWSEMSGRLLAMEARTQHEPDPDPTEDIADEVTSELAPVPPRPAAAPSLAAVPGPAARGVAPAPVAGAGKVLRDRYVLELPLGSGGSATVFRALDLRRESVATEDRHVAIKLLRPEFRDRPESIARLQREFRQTLAVAHPNIVRFHDLDCDRGCWFIVMELLSGETLGRALRRAGPAGLAREEALRIALAVGDALRHAHEHGVPHGDVKPGNIFLTRAGEVRLLDFGVAPGAADRTAPTAGPRAPAAATRSYASPEVLAGEPAETRDDVFSLACVTYEMLGGMLPPGRCDALATPQCGLAAPPAGLDAARWQVLAAALHPQRAGRPAMESLLRALRGEGERPPPPAEAPVPEASGTRAAAPAASAAAPAPRRPRRIAGAAILAIAACALALGFLIGRLDPAAVPSTQARETPPAVSAPASTAAIAPLPAPESPPAPAGPGTAPQQTVAAPAGRPGLVTFDAPTMRVSKRAVVAAIPLRHLSRVPRTVNVSWRLVDGTAQAGRDYGGPPSGVESFTEGNSFRILYVPLIADPDATGDRTFTVELTGATHGAEVGGAPRVEVTIAGEA